LARCPECRTENQTPTRTWRVLDEPTQAGRFSERSVGIFQCTRCGAVFPQVVGRRRLAIIDVDEYLKVKKEIEDLRAENSRLKDDADLVHLQSSVEALEKEVSALQNEKKDLEIRLAQGNGSLDQVP
jgi:FtsZ-binding cell division protein ZapB